MNVIKSLAPAGGATLGGAAGALLEHGAWGLIVGTVLGAAVGLLYLLVVSWRRMAERQQFSLFEPDVRRDLIDLERAQRAPAEPPAPT